MTTPPIERLHAELRRQVVDWDQDGMTTEGRPLVVKPLVDRVRAGETLTLAELADVCRALAWDVRSFYDALGVVSGDYHRLIELNGGVYFNLDAPGWDI